MNPLAQLAIPFYLTQAYRSPISRLEKKSILSA